MSKQMVSAPGAAPPIGPYSPAVKVGDFVFVSGQVGVDAEGRQAGFTAADQARAALDNLAALLAAAGLEMDAVVKTTIFLVDIDDFASVNAVYAEYFHEPYPARSTVQVSALPKDVKVEIEAVATVR